MMESTLKKSILMPKVYLRRMLLAILICSLSSVALYAQTTVSGKVSDESGLPIPGVSISVKGLQGFGTVTNSEGAYTISISEREAVLVFSFIGYLTKEVNTTGRSSIDVILNQDMQMLDDIVVVGYGTQRKSDVTSSISRVDGRDIENASVSNVAMALQGRAPGVEVISNGTPGRTPNIRIRGMGSLSATNPLVVLDGVPVEMDVFSQLAPAEIQSIEILKDAASGAIYGTRAANGVILVTTLTAKKNQKTALKLNSSGGVNSVISRYDVLNAEDLFTLKRESFTNDGLTIPANSPWGNQYYNTTRTNWQDEFFQNGLFQDYNMTISSGSEKSTINASLNFRDENGTQINTFFKRLGFNLKATQEISKRLKFEGNLRINQTNDLLNFDSQGSNGTLFAAYFYHPSIPVRYGNGNFGSTLEAPFTEGDWGSGRAHNDLGDMWNPIYKATEEWYETSSLNTLVNLKADLNITKNIVLTGRTSYSHRNLESETFNKPTPLQSRTIANPIISIGNNQRYSWLGELFTNYNQSFNKHNVTFTAGSTIQTFDGQNMQMNGSGFASLQRKNLTLNNAQVLTGSGTPIDPTALVSFFARANYNFDDKYYLSGTIRSDGSSRFAQGNQWGYFPGVSAAWRISNEKFMSKFTKVSNLKLNASWGQLGDQNVRPFQYLDVYVKDQNYILGGQNVTGTRPASFANPNITWETSEVLNLLLEVGLFNDRIQLEAGYFDKKTKGMLIPSIRQFTMGAIGIPDSNIGDMENKGFEFMLSTVQRIGENLQFNAGINTSFIKNRLLRLNGENSFIASGPARSYEGGELSAFYGWRTNGIYQNQEEINTSADIKNDSRRVNIKPGDVRFMDINGDGIINDNDRTQIGDSNPFMSYGFNFGAGYKGFNFSANFSGLLGYDVYDVTKLRNMQANEKFNMHGDAMQRWTGPGTSNKWPRLSRVAANQNYRDSDLAITNADFLRLKDLVFGYTIPTKFLRNKGIQNARLYLSGRNLLTLTNANLVDPEESSGFSNLRRGIISTEYPQSKTIAFGLDLTF